MLPPPILSGHPSGKSAGIGPLPRIGGFGCAVFLALALLLGMAKCEPAAAETAVDLQLVLAVDASGSVSEARFELQKQGYVAAFRSPQLLRAIGSGRANAIAVTMTQWTGPALQIQVVPWMLINDEASMLAVAGAIAAAPRQLFGGGTSISGAIDHAMTLFPTTELKGARRVIDVSGDGVNNRGRPAADARDDAVRAGVGINGLPILVLEPNLDHYYKDNVIGGPGAFVIAAESYATFTEAVLKKLVTEIAAAERPMMMRKVLGQGNGVIPGLVPGIHPSARAGASWRVDPGDPGWFAGAGKRRDDSVIAP